MSGTPGRFWAVSLGLANRQLLRLVKNPPLLIPSILFPLILFAAFTGAVSAISHAPNFGYPDYTAFQLVFVLMQGSVFAGVLVGVSLADDFESGFAKRIMLAVPQRAAILTGYLLMAFLRAVMVAAVLFVAGFIGGMSVRGSALQIVGLLALMLLLTAAAALFAAGVALRTQSVQAGPLMQMPMVVLMFLMPVYSPRKLLSGWIHTVANVNPFTPIVETGRRLLEDQAGGVGLAFAVLAGFIVLTAWFALTGLRKAERSAAGSARGGRRGRGGGGGGRPGRGRPPGGGPPGGGRRGRHRRG